MQRPVRDAVKRAVGKLPAAAQQSIKRLYYSHQLKHRQFVTGEPEFGMLDLWLRDGDWALDIGANIGHYTCRLAELVGQGRVVAFEPLPEAFELLASNVARWRNVTLLNAAASDRFTVLGLSVPSLPTGLPAHCLAHLDKDGAAQVMCMPVDALDLPPVRLVKIDVEGHELSVLCGMRALLERSHPILIVEGRAPEVVSLLSGYGYGARRYGRSPNLVYLPGRP